MMYPQPVVPRFSYKERDRRWNALRDLMRREGMDAIISFNNSSSWDQGNGNNRYLSSIGGNCASISVVFPLQGEVTAITGPVPAPDYWLQFQDWVTDIRTAFFNSTPVIIERLRELSLDKGRVGIAGLEGVVREPDGLVSATALRTIQEALPKVEFCNATSVMYEVRASKGEEEIEMLRHAVSLVEGALDIMDSVVGPGVTESSIYARMVAHLIEGGSEPGALLLMAAGNPVPPLVSTLPSRRELMAGDAIIVEMDAKWCGYLGHNAATYYASPPPDIVREMATAQFEATSRCWEAMRPGRRLMDLVEICTEVGKQSGFDCKLIGHSRGTGLDAPVIVNQARDKWTEEWVFPDNAVFVIKPTVTTSDGRHKIMWGDSVVATPDGGRRLGRRPPPYVG